MKYIVLFLSFFVAGGTYAQPAIHCQELLSAYKNLGFSGTAVVQSQDKTVCRSSIDPLEGKHFLIGSVSKQFTAAAVLLLAQRGSLKISDPLTKYVPTFPGGGRIQLHHLLSHTSGIGEIVDTQKFQELRATPFTSLKPLVDEIMTLPPEFSPGSQWSYSNSNYILLSQIIETVSGKSWGDFVQSEILNPLQMKDTSFATVKTPDLISGHQFDRDYNLVALSATDYFERGWAHGAGGLESTVDDLILWNKFLFKGQLLTPSWVAEMSSPHAAVDTDLTYGFGLFQRQDILGERVVFHSGGIPGFTSMNIYLPEKDLSIVVLSNSFDGVTTSRLAWDLLKIALGQSVEAPQNKEIILPQYQLKEKQGTYDFSELGFKMVVRFEDETVYSSFNGEPEYKLIPHTRYDFYHRAFNLSFTFSQDLHSVSLVINGRVYVAQAK